MADASSAAGAGGGRPRASLAARERERLTRALAADPPNTGLPALFLALTVLSGLIDAISVLHFRMVFVANMTGNLVFSGLGVAHAPGFAVAPSVLALAGFATGGVLCRTVPALGGGGRPLIRNAAAFETVLLAAAAAVSGATGREPGQGTRDALIVTCAVAFGIQNTVAARVGVDGLTTTVMTRTLAGLIDGFGDPAKSRRTTRQGLALALLFGGAAVGGVLVDKVSPVAAIGTGAALAAVVAAMAGRPTAPAAPA